MKRIDKAIDFMKKESSSLSNFSTISKIGMATLRIPGARKRLNRHLIDKAGNTGLSIGAMLAARKLGVNNDDSQKYSKASLALARDLGAPTLGKLIIKK